MDRYPGYPDQFIKIIRIILSLKDAINPTSAGMKRSSSVDALKDMFSPVSDIQPPVLYSSSRISLQTKQILQALQSILGIDPGIFHDQIVAGVVHGLRLDFLSKDALLYHSYMTTGIIWEVGLSNDSLLRWTRNEKDWASGLKNAVDVSVPYYQFGDTPAAYLVTIHEAANLKPKNSPTANNAYPFITYKGSSWIGPVIEGSLDPKFEHSFTLLLGSVESSSKMTVSLWNKPAEESKRESFLGCIMLSAAEILKISESKEIRTIMLEKRSKKSHISGKISISVLPLTTRHMDMKSLYGKGLNLIASDPKESYRSICRLCYEWSFLKVAESKTSTELAPISQEILKYVSDHWRIRSIYISLCALEIAYSLFCQGALPLDSLYTHFIDAFSKMSDVDAPSKMELSLFSDICKGVLINLNQLLRTFFNQDRAKGLSGKQLDAVMVMISAIVTSPILQIPGQNHIDVLEHVQLLLVESLSARFEVLLKEAKLVDAEDQFYLSALSNALIEELELYQKEFDIMVFGKLHLPSLGARILYDPMSKLLEEFSHSYVSSSPDMSFVFELYHCVRGLQRTCESIDFRFPMVRWFGPFVREWLSYSQQKLVQWVKSALDQDKFERVTPQAAHSSSILDIFTSFQQLIDFLKELDWPNEQENRRFYFAIYYDTIGALYRYCQLSTEVMVRVLAQTRSFQPPPPPKKAKIGKLRVTIPKMYRKKVLDSSPHDTRLSAKSCIVLLNMFAIPARFDSFVSHIPQLNSPESPTTKNQGNIIDPLRFLFCVTILDANLRPVRPWVSQLYLKVTNNLGKELGMTATIPQSTNPVWNESVYALHDTSAATLTFGIWHYLPGQKDVLYAIGQSSTDGIKNGSRLGVVQFENYGTLNIKLEVLQEDTTVLCSIIRWMVESTQKRMIRLLVEQLSFDFRERIHELSLKYKTNVIKSFFKDSIEPLKDTDIADIEEYLSPLFEFLNSNLEILMTNMDDSLAFEVVLGAWNRFVVDAEALISPTLYEEVKERKPWDERRFQFFKKFMEIAFEFFLGDGQGLKESTLDSIPYICLKNIIANYFTTREDLANAYLNGGETHELEWILKLIKMKGGKDFTEDCLKRRVIRNVIAGP